jgi:class 3 adenylate cyclase
MIVESRGGDALVIVHDDPVARAQTARQIMDEIYQALGQPHLSMALHHGEVQMRERDLVPVIAGGDAILCAARIEPHVEPGRIWATEDFPPGACPQALAVAGHACPPLRGSITEEEATETPHPARSLN